MLLAKLRAHFYTGNYICLYRAICGAVPDFEKISIRESSEITDFGQGDNFPLRHEAYPIVITNLF